MNRQLSIGSVVAAWAACAAVSDAHVVLHIVPDVQEVQRGAVFSVDIYADMSAPILVWGFDFHIANTEVAFPAALPLIGPGWIPTPTTDGDGLGGVSLAPAAGTGILLATIEMLAVGNGDTLLSIDVTDGDLTEGFGLLTPGEFDSWEAADAFVTVVPAPGAIALIPVALLFARRRRH